MPVPAAPSHCGAEPCLAQREIANTACGVAHILGYEATLIFEDREFLGGNGVFQEDSHTFYIYAHFTLSLSLPIRGEGGRCVSLPL
jgi:hypothetical protein